jgi:hypothetical protein
MKPIIILSSAFIGPELAAEYGRLPPSFLPVGHKRLYELQYETLTEECGCCEIYLTLPESFRIPISDFSWLIEHRVNIIPIPDGVLLGEAILNALSAIEKPFQEFGLLHGDTLIYQLPLSSKDVVAMGSAPDIYDWGYLSKKDQDKFNRIGSTMVLAGYFNFGSLHVFRNALEITNNNFVEAVNLYSEKYPLAEFLADNWLDFGHLLTFYRSRCHVRTQRVFNDLSINDNEVKKSGLDEGKITAEAEWFKAIPPNLRRYTPAFLGEGKNPKTWYKLEYISNPSLHELFVFGSLPYSLWSQILGGCFKFIDDCSKSEKIESKALSLFSFKSFVLSKTKMRIKQFYKFLEIDLDTKWLYNGTILPTLDDIAEITASEIKKNSAATLGVMHGDFCFTNIFYDYRNSKVQVIDPRGVLGDGKISAMGDIRYDIAKLKQSVNGYDFILANRYQCTGFEDRNLKIDFPENEKMVEIEKIAENFYISGVGFSDRQINAIVIHLYLSMLPLHFDRPEHQKAFLANALRLYTENFH